MAEIELSLNEFKKQFNEQLRCSVCLDHFVNPKSLLCHHSFCLECIQPLPVKIEVIVPDSYIYNFVVNVVGPINVTARKLY